MNFRRPAMRNRVTDDSKMQRLSHLQPLVVRSAKRKR
jgi:hypothetical protein